MFLKSLIAAAIIMGLTGGFIYWGTDVQPSKSALKSEAVEKLEETPKEVPEKVSEELSGETSEDVTPADAPKSNWTDLNLRQSSTPQETVPDQTTDVEAEAVELVDATPDETIAPKEDAEVVESVEVQQDEHVSRIIVTSLIEAEKITQLDLKDQAFLRLVDYAVANGEYGQAKSILGSLSSPELRDTARSRIAIGMALNGQDTEAFDLLRDVEVEALQDVLRLQVIEAATDLSIGNPSPN